jgi:hypothetical protein
MGAQIRQCVPMRQRESIARPERSLAPCAPLFLLRAEELRHTRSPMLEDALQLRPHDKPMRRLAEPAKGQRLRDAIDHSRLPLRDFVKAMLVMPKPVRPDALLIHKVAHRLHLRDLRQPSHANAPEWADPILNQQAGVHLGRHLRSDFKAQRFRSDPRWVQRRREESPHLFQAGRKRLFSLEQMNGHAPRIRVSDPGGYSTARLNGPAALNDLGGGRLWRTRFQNPHGSGAPEIRENRTSLPQSACYPASKRPSFRRNPPSYLSYGESFGVVPPSCLTCGP